MAHFKVSVFLVFCLGVTSQLSAQFAKGATLIEADLGISLGIQPDQSSPTPISMGTTISLGRFISSRNEIGLQLGVGYSRNASPGLILNASNLNPAYFEGTDRSNSFLLGAYFQRYTRIFEKLSFAAAFSANYGLLRVRDDDGFGPIESDFQLMLAGVSPSLIYRLSPKLGLRGTFGFLGFNMVKFEEQKWQGVFGLTFQPSALNFGIFFLLNDTTIDN